MNSGRNGLRANGWQTLALTVLALVTLSATATAGNTVLFEETFDNYGVQAPGFHENCRTREWPPSQKFMAFEPEEESRMFAESVRVKPDAPGWKNYELRFRFRFFGDSTKHFDIELPLQSTRWFGRDKTFSIGYAENYELIAPGGKATPQGRATLATPLLNNHWYDGWIRVQGGKLTAWLDNGTTVELGSVGMRGLSTRGFNVRTDTKVMFDYFRVVELPATPTETGANQDVCLRTTIPALTRQESDMHTVVTQETHTVAIPAEANRASATVRVGDAGKMKISLVWTDDSTTAINVKVGEQSCQKPSIKEGKQTTEKTTLPDALLTFTGGLKLTRHVRPDITRYEQLDLLRVVQAWDTLPSAAQHSTKFQVRLDPAGVQYWIDERYAGRTDSATRLKALAFELLPGGAIGHQHVDTVEDDTGFLALDAGAIACPGAMATATVSLEPGRHEIGGIPFTVVGGAHSVDVGVAREHRGSWALECDLYLSCSPFAGVPDALRLPVPVAQYNRAYVLCAVEEDPEKVPILTARLTHFKPGALVGVSTAIATTTLALPRGGGSAAPGVRKVGTVQYDADDNPRTVPLYLVEFPLDVGSIQDLIFQSEGKVSYLDIDLIGKPRQNTQQWKLSHKPDPLTRSAVHVFGLTLARSPVEMTVMPGQVGNAYYPDEKPKMSVNLRALEAKSCVLHWEISDVAGTPLETQTRDLSFARAGEKQTIDVAFSQQETGWYGVRFTLTDKAGPVLITHTASFVRQPVDTRRAGYESPYYSWWYGGAGGTTKDIDVIGPLMKRAGIRRTNLKSEAAAVKYTFTGAYLHGVERLYNKDDLTGSAEKMLETIRANRQKFPHLDHALIYHESCSGPFPVELLGKTPVLSEAQAAYARRKAETATFVARIYREKFPDVKLVVGNSGSAVGGLAYLFREGYPADLIDFMGEESAGQTIPPEKNEAIGGTAYTFWMLRQLALKFGYKQLQPVACHERNYRSSRSLGPVRAAAWTVRDALIVHAWRSPLVPIMGPENVRYSYGNSVWGDFGMFSRHPQTYPYPGFSAMSALTRVLDGAVFRRQLETGSLTVYALEFSRGKEHIYALWAARGDVEMTLAFADDTSATVTDLWGREKKRETAAKTLNVKTGTEPVYVTVPAQVETIAAGARTFPDDAVPEEATVAVANGMTNAGEWEIIGDVDPRIDNPGEHGDYPPFRQPGDYRLRQVVDDERGACLELELVKAGEIPTIMHEYAFLKLKAPAPVPGTPTTVGVWVKGNSGWGQLMWEYQDAEGEKWLSCGTGGYGCNVYDWPGQASINFDGWNFVQFPITQESPIRVESPGAVLNEWQRDGTGNGRLDYPIKLTGIMLSMQRQAINLTKMDPVKTVVRLSDFSAYGN